MRLPHPVGSLDRRRFLAAGVATSFGALAPNLVRASSLPHEPLVVGAEPQFVFDLHAIDNLWALKYKSQAVQRIAHVPKKYAGNPLVGPRAGYACVRRDAADGRFRMWYQSYTRLGSEKRAGNQYDIRYAESDDGLTWTQPALDLVEFEGSRANNIVLGGMKERYSGPFLVDAPPADRRGYRYLLAAHTREGQILVGSHDGIQWDVPHRQLLKHLHSDTQNAIVYDPLARKYRMYCRAKHVYRTFQGDIVDTGESRRIALLTNDELWSPWDGDPQNILVPDEADFADAGFNAFYGMPVRYYGGVFWGALWRFRFNDDVHTQLAFSRDGVRFERLPTRPKLFDLGEPEAWDDGMAFGSMDWVEVGDEWWFYYAGSDGPHGAIERSGAVGLAKLRKEGFISLRGPAAGGVVVTRPLRRPPGDLVVNAAATDGELRVRVTDASRKPIPGFDYDDCTPLTSDGVRQSVRWKDRSLAACGHDVVRFEFLLRDADLFTFLIEPKQG